MKINWSCDSPLISKANVVADVVFLNLVYLVCCLPLVTIGSATAAMAGVSVSFLNKDTSGVKLFWKLFRNNLRTFLLPWLGVLFFGVFLIFDAYLLFLHPITGAVIFAVILILLLILYAMILAHIFLLHAKFELKFRYLLSNAVLLSLAHPLRTIALLILELFPWVCFFFFPQAFVFLTPVWLLCYFPLASFAMVKTMKPVYDRLVERSRDT